MKRAITLGLVLAVAAMLPASGAFAGNGKGKGLAAKQCAAEKKADKAAFKGLYGKRAMRTCVKGAKSEIKEDRSNAAQDCREERSTDPDAFREKYGTNSPRGEKSRGGKRNAFGVCVRQAVKAESEEEVEDFENAAQECRDERSADPDAFRETYGTNSPKGEKSKGAKRNALGKCVSSKVKESETETETEEGGE